MYPYRVFICYAHEDIMIAQRIVEHLERVGLRPMWDRNLPPGWAFSEQIRSRIAFAHAFMPIITESSTRRPWVHQEIGYAVGLDVPTIPVAVGEVPTGIIQQLQALNLAPGAYDLEQGLTAETIGAVVARLENQHHPRYECAELPEDRTEMIARYADRVLALGESGHVRQVGALTSFSIPDLPEKHEVWTGREGSIPRSTSYRRLQRAERQVLERHARAHGCSLVINPRIESGSRGPGAARARLSTLLAFLRGMTDDKARVAVTTEISGNILLVGDWFVAHAMSSRPGVGYLQTVCTTHGATVLEQIRRFDEDFDGLSARATSDAASSRLAAIEIIEGILGADEK